MKKLKYIGKLQRKVLYALLEKPSTRVGIIENTGLTPNDVDIALKSLIYKEYVCREGINFKIKDEDENTIQPTAGSDTVCVVPADRSLFVWDIPQRQGDLQPAIGDQGEERADNLSAN